MGTTRNPEVLRLKLKSKRLPLPVADFVRPILNRLFGFSKFNEIYRNLPPCGPLDLSRTLLDSLGVRLVLDGERVDSVPARGPLLVVANHPSGIIEGLVIDVLLGARRPDGALMAVHMLAPFPEFEGRVILVGPRGRRARQRHSLRGWRQSFRLLARGGALAVFPAGGVARFSWRRLRIADPPWTPHVAALARRSGATVLPVYFDFRNGFLFQLVGAICKPLQDLMIVGETAKLRGRALRVSLGKVIAPHELARFSTDEEAVAFLRARTEALARS